MGDEPPDEPMNAGLVLLRDVVGLLSIGPIRMFRGWKMKESGFSLKQWYEGGVFLFIGLIDVYVKGFNPGAFS